MSFNAWLSELNRILVVFVPCILIGLVIGHLQILFIIALMVYGLWTARQLVSLKQWLDQGAVVEEAPEYSGIADQHVSSMVDIQKKHLANTSNLEELIEHYKNISPNSQLIVATHSPFIAASFEPEERFVLFFDEDGKVCVKNGKSPIGDDPNDLLKNDFSINYYNKYGESAYKKYIDLKQKVANEKDKE